MAGLLYKDFIGIKGRRIVLILTGCTLFFLILRFLFPGNVTTVTSMGMTENEAGELVEMSVGELRDSMLVQLLMRFMIVGLYPATTWSAAICRHDEKNKT